MRPQQTSEKKHPHLELVWSAPQESAYELPEEPRKYPLWARVLGILSFCAVSWFIIGFFLKLLAVEISSWLQQVFW